MYFVQSTLEQEITIRRVSWWHICVTSRSCGSVAQWSECSHGLRGVLGSNFLPCDVWWPVWVRARAANSKGTVSSDPAWFRADSGTNLIKQGGHCHRSTMWLRGVLGSSPGRAMCFFLPCDICINQTNWLTITGV